MKYILIINKFKGKLTPRGGGASEIFEWGCAAGTPEPLAYTCICQSYFS